MSYIFNKMPMSLVYNETTKMVNSTINLSENVQNMQGTINFRV